MQGEVVKNDRQTFGPLAEDKRKEWRSGVSPGFIQEDDWIRQETERYTRLLRELKQTRWFAAWSQKHAGDQYLNGPGHRECSEEDFFFHSDALRLTDEELRNGGLSTMEQILLQHYKQQRSTNTFVEDLSDPRRAMVRSSLPMQKRELSLIYCKAGPELTPSPVTAHKRDGRHPEQDVSGISRTDKEYNQAQVMIYDPQKTT